MNQEKSNFLVFETQCEAIKRICRPKISNSKPIYIFGAGGFGRSIAKTLKTQKFDVRGFIETSPTQKKVDNISMVSWGELTKARIEAQLLIGIYNRDSPFDALVNAAKSAGFNDIFMPWDIYSQFSDELGWRYWLSRKEVILDNIHNINRVFELLSDEESKKTLLNICKFRLGLSNEYASFKHVEGQYFNSLTLNRFANLNKCVYLDCGAYNGDTFIEAENRLPLTDAYLFEPNCASFKQLVEVTKKSRISPKCLPLAVSDKYQILAFDGNGEGAAISANGSVKIACISLDEFMPNGRVDIIKFDVEGAETAAINGAKKLLNRSRPTIIVSLYHRPNDVWEIPLLITKYCKNYQYYIRQHFYNSFDSVLYAIPKNKDGI